MLIDKDMVIKALNTEINDAKIIHSTYARFVPAWVLENALTFLETPPVKVERREETQEWNVCSYCGNHLISKWKWCPYCGRGIDWNA